MSEDALLATRARFPILQTATYLVSNSLGAMPEAVEDGLALYARQWRELGVRAWADSWWELTEEVADRVAPLLGASAGSVAMQPSTTVATSTFLSCLRPTAQRRKVVTTQLQFPSILYALEGWCRDHAVELVIVAKTQPWGTDRDALLAAVDDQTLAVAVSHVEFASAYINDAEALARRCRDRGALLLLDVFQSAGTLPLRLDHWGVDAAVGGCLKWLCGGPGNAYLYVRPQLADTLRPALTGWLAHPAPFAFEPPPMRHRRGGARFLNGTPQVAALYAAIPGLDILHCLDIAAIRTRSLELCDLLYREAQARGYGMSGPPDPTQRGGTVTLDISNAEHVARELLARDVVVDYRPGWGIRIAPHFYSTAEECARCVEEIEHILSDGGWKRHTTVSGTRPT